MGKTSKSISALSSKQKKLKHEKTASQKVTKKGIQKGEHRQLDKNEQKKQDMLELKMLLRLDADAPIDPALLSSDAPLIPIENQNVQNESMQVDQTTKYRKPSQK